MGVPAGTWIEDEDDKLDDAVQIYGGKDWGAIAALVPGRNKNQCRCRWTNYLNLRIARPASDPLFWFVLLKVSTCGSFAVIVIGRPTR